MTESRRVVAGFLHVSRCRRMKNIAPPCCGSPKAGNFPQRPGPARTLSDLETTNNHTPHLHPTAGTTPLQTLYPVGLFTKSTNAPRPNTAAQDVLARYVMPGLDGTPQTGQLAADGNTSPAPRDHGDKLVLTIIAGSLYRRYVCGPRPALAPDAQSHVHARCSPASSLLRSGHLDRAAIIPIDGASTWATSTGFTVNASACPPPSQTCCNTSPFQCRGLTSGVRPAPNRSRSPQMRARTSPRS